MGRCGKNFTLYVPGIGTLGTCTVYNGDWQRFGLGSIAPLPFHAKLESSIASRPGH
jgi:hypothetical protein